MKRGNFENFGKNFLRLVSSKDVIIFRESFDFSIAHGSLKRSGDVAH